jgi:MFS family permease
VRYRKGLWSISFLCFVAYAWLATSIGPVLPSVSGDFLLSPATAGFMAGLYSLGGLLSLVGGYVSDRFNRALAGSLFLALFSASSILVASSGDGLTFGVFLLLMGVFAGFIEATVNALISEVYAERRGFSMVLFQISWNVGSALGPPFAAVSMAMLGGWRPAYLVPALLLLLLSGVLSVIGRKIGVGAVAVARVKARGKARASTGLGHVPIVISSITAFYVAAEMGLSNWLPSILESLGSGKLEAGLANGLFWGSMGIGRICWAPLTERLGYGRTVLASSSLSLALILAASLQLTALFKTGLWTLTGFCLAPIFPAIIAWVTSLEPESAGLLSGLAYTNGALGAFTSTWSAGLVAGSFGIGASQHVFTVFALLMCVDVALALRLERAKARGCHRC